MADCCDNFILDEAQDDFGFSGGIGGTLPISMGGTGATSAEVAALNIIGPLPTVSGALDEYDKVLFQQNGTAAIRKRRADAFAQDMWDMLYKDAEPIEDSTAPITSGAVYRALGGIFSPVKYATPGALVHISDGAYNQPVQGIRIAVNPVQDMHGFDHPWPGGGGKNLIPQLFFQHSSTMVYVGIDREATYIHALPEGTYTLSASLTASGRFFIREENGSSNVPVGSASLTPSGSFTVPAGGGVYQIWIYNGSGFSAANVNWVQLEFGSTATEYEPYENICPITGWDSAEITRTGSNLISPFDGYATQTDKGITTTFDGENVSIIGTSTAGNTNSTNMLLASPLRMHAGKTYVFAINGNWSTPNLRLRLRDESGDLWYGDSNNCIWTVIPTTDLTITRVGFRVTASGSTIDVSGAFYCNLNMLTAYEAYKGEVYEISFGSAGTVYVGTLTYNEDGTWTLIVDHYTMTVTGNDITTTVNLGDVIRTNLVYVESGKNSTGRNATAISNWLPRIDANYSGNAPGFYFDSNTRIYIKVPNNAVGVTGETSWEDRLALTKAFFDDNPFFVVYPLATSLSFTLTGPEVLTLLAQNSFWADTGDIEELAYRADIGLYLMEALNPIKEMLAYREDTMRATRAYTAGDFIVIGDTFFKVIVPIANGAILTPGTNVSATTVGAQLKLLS